MFDLFSSNDMIQAMDKSLTLASRRTTLIASNLANIDTPGYHTKDFSFTDALKQELGTDTGPNLPIQTTNPMHLSSPNTGFMPPTTDPVRPAYERNDGNDVSLDRETMLLGRTQITYQLASSFAQGEIRRIYQAIRDGAK